MRMEHTFKHSGSLGDLIYSLPAIRALGGGRLYIETSEIPGFGEPQAAGAIPLLESLDYITSAQVRAGEKVDIDLDGFRCVSTSHTNLARAHLAALELDVSLGDSPWMAGADFGATEAYEVVFTRSPRRHPVAGFWERALQRFGRRAVFAGLPEEHAEFEARFGRVPFAATRDLRELAALIAMADLFVGNQSCPFAIAIGLGKNCILEVDSRQPNCLFYRPEVINIQAPEDLWKMDLAEESLRERNDPTWQMSIPTPMGRIRDHLQDQLVQVDRFELALRARQPVRLRFAPIGAEPGERINLPVQAGPGVESALLENLFRITLQEGGELDAEPIPPLVDLSTAGELGPAELPGCSIIVLTYNSGATIERCVRCAAASTGEEDELIVVDNASSDGSSDIIQQLSAEVPLKFIQNEKNLGFSAGMNAGIRQSRGRYVALLNPDAFVPPDWLPKLIKRFEDPLVGAAGPLSNMVAGEQFVGHHLPADTGPWLGPSQLADLLDQRHPDKSKLTKLLIGFCLVLKRRTLARVGLLDEELFLGSDDLELSLRLRSHGLRLVVARDVLVWHESGASFASLAQEEKDRILDQSSLALKAKIEKMYLPGPLPDSRLLWDSDIFGHMLPSTSHEVQLR